MLAFRAFVWPPNPVRARESHRRNSKVTCTAQNLVVDKLKAFLQHIEEHKRVANYRSFEVPPTHIVAALATGCLMLKNSLIDA